MFGLYAQTLYEQLFRHIGKPIGDRNGCEYSIKKFFLRKGTVNMTGLEGVTKWWSTPGE